MTGILLELAPRPVELDGVTVGVLAARATAAADSAHYLDQLTARLEKRHFLATVIRVVKPTDHEPCPASTLDELAQRCDVVIIGVAQTAESAEFVALDAVALERMSVPCAVLIRDGLGSVVQQACTANGYDGQSSAIELSLPAAGQPIDVQALVEASFRDVERVLTADPSAGVRQQTASVAPQPPEPRGPAPRNGEVSCEC